MQAWRPALIAGKARWPAAVIAGIALASAGVIQAPRMAQAPGVRTSAVTESGPARQTRASSLLVIQGRVTALASRGAVVRTPDQRPACRPGQVCAMYIIAGTTFKVDLSGAVYQGADGRRVQDRLSVGEQVVVAGTGGAPASSGVHTLHALVITRNMAATVGARGR